MKVFHKANIYFLVLGHKLCTVLRIGYWNTKVVIQEPWHYCKTDTTQGKWWHKWKEQVNVSFISSIILGLPNGIVSSSYWKLFCESWHHCLCLFLVSVKGVVWKAIQARDFMSQLWSVKKTCFSQLSYFFRFQLIKLNNCLKVCYIKSGKLYDLM